MIALFIVADMALVLQMLLQISVESSYWIERGFSVQNEPNGDINLGDCEVGGEPHWSKCNVFQSVQGIFVSSTNYLGVQCHEVVFLQD